MSDSFVFQWIIKGETTIVADTPEEAREKFDAMARKRMFRKIGLFKKHRTVTNFNILNTEKTNAETAHKD